MNQALRSLREGVEPIRSARISLVAPDIERYRRDPFAHCDDGHMKVLDLVTNELVSFHPWEHQREVAAAWIDLERLAVTGRPSFSNIHEEKSRQEGLTVLFAVLVHWLLTYHDVQGGMIHRRGAEVCDSGPTQRSFFGKVKTIQESFPDQYRAPLRFVTGNAPVIRNEEHPLRFFIGESATLDPTRGGSYAYWIIDEAARIPWGRAVHAALSRSTPTGRVYNSTPYGKGNVYHWLRETRPAGYKFLRHHWSGHPVYGEGAHIAAVGPFADEYGHKTPGRLSTQPNDLMRDYSEHCQTCQGTILGLRWLPEDPTLTHRYPGKVTSPWYDREIADMTEVEVAQELDIDYSGSLGARVYPEFSPEVHVVPYIPYEPSLDLEGFIDYGLDTTSVGIVQDAPDSVRQIAEFEIGDTTPDGVVAGLREMMRLAGVPERLLEPEWMRRMTIVGDPAGEARSLNTGESLVSVYQRVGLTIVSTPRKIAPTIIAAKRLLLGKPKPYRISEEACPETIRHFESNVWPTDREGRRKPTNKPKDDIHNHSMRAFAYYAAYKFPPPVEGETDVALRSPDEERWGNTSGKHDESLSYDMKLRRRPYAGSPADRRSSWRPSTLLP